MSLVEIQAPAEQTEGTRSQVLRWLKNVGDSVSEHEPLIEIETDKVTVEVAAPASGVLREILKGESEEIAPGDVLGRLEPANSASETTKSAAKPAVTATPSAKSEEEAAAAARATINLSPAVRRLLNERGLDVTQVRGSGEGGRITIDDVLAYKAKPRDEISIDDVLAPGGVHAASAEGASVAARADGGSEAPGGDAGAVAPVAARRVEAKQASDNSANQLRPTGAPSTHTIPHTAIRKRTAAHMVQSLLETSPHVTTVFEADMSAVMSHRSVHRADFDAKGAPLTFTAYFLAASVKAIQAVPEANARWTDQALELYDDINIGVATALPEVGLVVPVLHHLENKSLFEIAQALHQRVTAARAGKLQPADVRNGTFTISNHGVSGSLLAAPIIINQPQSSILGIGKLEKRPVVIDNNGKDELVIRPKCYVTLTIDHRVMDGYQANRFLQVFVQTLESWAQ